MRGFNCAHVRMQAVPNSEVSPIFSWAVRVYYEDTDSGGVVYHANYLKFMERARSEWLRDLGFEQDDLRSREGILFAVRRAELDYLAPALFNDALTVCVRGVQPGGASLVFDQEIRRSSDQTLCCRGRIKVACIDEKTLRPVRIPENLLAEMTDVR